MMSQSVQRNEGTDAEMVEEYLAISRLQDMGLNQSDVKKLEDAGYKSVGMVMAQPRKKLEEIRGFSEAKVNKVVEAANKLIPFNFVTGTECLQSRQSILKISTGSQALNEMIGGGFHSKGITEIHGEFRTGKTQLMHTLCITTQMPMDQGGAEGKVCFIDTEGTFRPERIKEIATNYGFDPDTILDNIFCIRVTNHNQQMECVKGVVALITGGEPIKLLIVDSLMALFRVEFSGRGELSVRQQAIARHLRDLQIVADEFNIPVVLTNQMTADPGAMIAACSQKPIGGNIVAHMCQTRLMFKKGRENCRIVKLIDSPQYPEADCQIALTAKGAVDP
jgi:meiotic recombination protein DMC1